MQTTTDLILVVADVEHVDDNGYTRAYVVPAGTPISGYLDLDAVDHIDVPASEDEPTWWQGLRDAAAHDGWVVGDTIADDRRTIVLAVTEA